MTKHARGVGVAPSLEPTEVPEPLCDHDSACGAFVHHEDWEDHQDPENATGNGSATRPGDHAPPGPVHDAQATLTAYALRWLQREEERRSRGAAE